MKPYALLFVVASFFYNAIPSYAVVACGNEASVMAQPPAANPQTLAWTPDSGSNRVAIVAISFIDTDADNTTITSVTSSAGGTFTQYGFRNEEAGATDLVSAIFYSTDFVDGAQTLSVTYSTTVTAGGYAAYVCTGVNRASPWRGTATVDSANGALSISIAVPSSGGDLVIDNAAVTSLPAGEAPAEGAGQTAMYKITPSNDNLDGVGSTEAGASGTVTMSWSWSTSDRASIVGGSLVPAKSAGSAIFID